MQGQDEFLARIEAANNEYVKSGEQPDAPPDPNGKPVEAVQLGTGKSVSPWLPIDLYNNSQKKLSDNSKKDFPNGSPALVMAVTKDIIKGNPPAAGLARDYKRAKGDIELYLRRKEAQRAEIAARQYMEEKFLPAIEAVIEYTSPDELLNCKQALTALDELAIGSGAMNGYTASYVREAYGNQLGRKRGESDPTVRDAVNRIVMLANNDQIRTAVGMAVKMKEQIDNGQHIASPEDYDVLGRVVAYAN